MRWFEDPTVLEKLKDDESRREWSESGCYDCFHDLEMKFPKDQRERTRMGALLLKEIQGTEGLHCWMAPVEGHPKIIGPNNRVKIFDLEAAQVFHGSWGESDGEWIKNHPQFFLWLEPRVGHGKPELDWKTRAIGIWRRLRHGHRGKK